MKNFLTHSLYVYDKNKMNLLKAILPFVIIIHHIEALNISGNGIGFLGQHGPVVMNFFFAMSGFGLVISYKKREKYIDDFLQKSLSKLFIPYLLTLLLFVIYRSVKGIDQIDLFMQKGVWSFVPTSWYIWVLSYFYVFFYIVFKYTKYNIQTKVILVCALVLGYIIVASHIGMAEYRYKRCPSFCVGMIFALFDEVIRKRFVRWQILLALLLLIIMINFSHLPLNPLFNSSILFLSMYAIKDIKEMRIVKFISSISLEMFIIQYIPINTIICDFHFKSTFIVIILVITLDIILAYIMHRIISTISK